MSGALIGKYWRELLIIGLFVICGVLANEIRDLSNDLTDQKTLTHDAERNVKTLQAMIDAQNEAKEASAATAKLVQADLTRQLAELTGTNKDLSKQIADFESAGEDLKTCTEDQAKDYGKTWQLLKAYRKGMVK